MSIGPLQGVEPYLLAFLVLLSALCLVHRFLPHPILADRFDVTPRNWSLRPILYQSSVRNIFPRHAISEICLCANYDFGSANY
ncbi:hypothetical protein Hypma_006581 [Hypsizygus marmoreus]|uniref:Uncharacterized protein n=1 Tax=Hypsizygus marmoreus TaxID=39966 RepID=A0A369JYK4_HYPMA|nr:hypothetical protein Hypma_006581 [Hypsizygus marmoreus]